MDHQKYFQTFVLKNRAESEEENIKISWEANDPQRIASCAIITATSQEVEAWIEDS